MQRLPSRLIGRLRLSMSFRISLNYLKLMIVNGIIFMAVFLVLYLNAQTEEYRELAEQVVAFLVRASSSSP